MEARGQCHCIANQVVQQRLRPPGIFWVQQAQRHGQGGLTIQAQQVSLPVETDRQAQFPLRFLVKCRVVLGQDVELVGQAVRLPVRLYPAHRGQFSAQIRSRLGHDSLVYHKPGAMGLDHALQDVGGQIGVAVVGNPPSPAAIIMLLVVKAL